PPHHARVTEYPAALLFRRLFWGHLSPASFLKCVYVILRMQQPSQLAPIIRGSRIRTSSDLLSIELNHLVWPRPGYGIVPRSLHIHRALGMVGVVGIQRRASLKQR
ncbi:hypothetical protein JMJ77_0008792, partial [Colletotrichum scovillei]